MTESVPVVDLADFLSNDINKKNAFIYALGKAYETVGFVSVINHGLPDKVICDDPKAYEDITAGNYLDERLREIGLKK